MDRIKGAGHVNNRFVTEDAGAGRAPTEITDVWLNSVQEEIISVIADAGIVLDASQNNQLLNAIISIAAFQAQIKINTLVGAAPGALNTIYEIAAQLYTDEGVVAGLVSSIAAKLPLAGGAMSGPVVLFAGTSAPTPAMFDNDTSLATTEFVTRLGYAFPRNGGIGIGANTQMAANDAGRWYEVYGGATVTLPLLADVPIGAAFSFRSITAFTLAGSGGQTIAPSAAASGPATYSAKAGECFAVVSNGSGWYVIYSGFGGGSFSASLGPNGYRRLPSGEIEQWGYVTESVSGTDYKNFTIPFPTACDNIILQIEAATTGGLGANVGTTVQVVDNTKFLWTGAGTYGGGGVAFYRAIGR